jgi:hypothetical protein
VDATTASGSFKTRADSSRKPSMLTYRRTNWDSSLSQACSVPATWYRKHIQESYPRRESSDTIVALFLCAT